MSLMHALLLALIQGVTEFLPVSSSAHLQLVQFVTPFPAHDKLYDVGLHGATLLAVLLYFRHDLTQMTIGSLRALQGQITPPFYKVQCLIISTLPVIITGACVSLFEISFPETWLGANMIIFGILIGWADHKGRKNRTQEEITRMEALVIGMCQAFAVVPGVSRLGACLIGTLMIGLSRVEALKYALLLSIPSVVGAIAMTVFKESAGKELVWDYTMTVGACMALSIAMMTLRWVFVWLSHNSLRPIVIYRIIIGLVILLGR
ncbi:MAG: undecaprenyl-diphosphate phosphatase [Alphaproteobacteria bacterium]|nr:MAG: undecaprenyl-diphosphate phosphatase [Alphaproteobacteria bacterium]